MTKCAKCGREIKPNQRYSSIGDMIYGIGMNPLLCVKCRIAWGKYIREKLYPMNSIWHKEWKKHFEKWLGYKWTCEYPMVPERVVFT